MMRAISPIGRIVRRRGPFPLPARLMSWHGKPPETTSTIPRHGLPSKVNVIPNQGARSPSFCRWAITLAAWGLPLNGAHCSPPEQVSPSIPPPAPAKGANHHSRSRLELGGQRPLWAGALARVWTGCNGSCSGAGAASGHLPIRRCGRCGSWRSRQGLVAQPAPGRGSEPAGPSPADAAAQRAAAARGLCRMGPYQRRSRCAACHPIRANTARHRRKRCSSTASRWPPVGIRRRGTLHRVSSHALTVGASLLHASAGRCQRLLVRHPFRQPVHRTHDCTVVPEHATR